MIWDQPTTNPVHHMARLFAGRVDAYAVDNPNGGMRPVRVDSEQRWLAAMELHLHGSTPIGVYPLCDDNTVTWGCIDVDCHNGTPLDTGLVANIMRALSMLGLSAWEEVSRSAGRHIWVFASEPVPAITMRNALLAVGQILRVELDEVNPKQTTLTGEGLGNLVRIPYAGGMDRVPNRQVVVDAEGELIGLRAWLRAALQTRNTPAALAEVAALYRAPLKAATVSAPPAKAGDRYFIAALEGERLEIASLPAGSRNHRLYQSALKLGRFVPDHAGAEDLIIDTLLAAANENGLLEEDGEHVVLGTIKSGIRNGAARLSRSTS
jgi:hypothetical protein